MFDSLPRAVGILLAIFFLALCAFGFNLLTLRRFNYRFFTLKMFLLLTLSIALWVAGLAVRVKGGDVPGYSLIGASCVVFWWILYLNFTRTNFLYGLAGSVAQIGLFSTLAYAGMVAVLLSVGAFIAFMALFQPVYVMNKKE